MGIPGKSSQLRPLYETPRTPYTSLVQVNRVSHEGDYLVDMANKPLNPRGRTGVGGRGVLGKWGPNHAADPVVTRWKLADNGHRLVAEESGKPVLEFVCIQRRDTGVWAIPGGMVDPGERVSLVWPCPASLSPGPGTRLMRWVAVCRSARTLTCHGSDSEDTGL